MKHNVSEIPPGPESGFGKEKTRADIKARIAWERWAAEVQRAKGCEAVAQAHDLTRVTYEDFLRFKLEALACARREYQKLRKELM